MIAQPRPLIEVFADLPDFRKSKGKRHPLPGSDPDGDPPGPVSPGAGFTGMTVADPRFEPFAAIRSNRVAALAAEREVSPAFGMSMEEKTVLDEMRAICCLRVPMR